MLYEVKIKADDTFVVEAKDFDEAVYEALYMLRESASIDTVKIKEE